MLRNVNKHSNVNKHHLSALQSENDTLRTSWTERIASMLKR